MVRWLIILLLLIGLASAKTETIELGIGESSVSQDRTITLLNLNDKDDKIILCINNEKNIVSDIKTINNVFIELRKIDKDIARFKIRYTCKNCVCDQDCNNNACLINPIIEESAEEQLIEIAKTTEQEEPIVITSRNTASFSPGAFAFILAAIIAVIVILYLGKKK